VAGGSLVAVTHQGTRSGRKSGERNAPTRNLTKLMRSDKIVYTAKLLESNEKSRI
jgi:hypothetical protein